MKIQDQYQVGQFVVVDHLGIFTHITGYVFLNGVNGISTIEAYQLDCGLQAPHYQLRRPTSDEYAQMKWRLP